MKEENGTHTLVRIPNPRHFIRTDSSQLLPVTIERYMAHRL
jgi:hypothetical protein